MRWTFGYRALGPDKSHISLPIRLTTINENNYLQMISI